MTSEQVLFAILGVLLGANAILLASIPFRLRRGRAAAGQATGDEPDATAIEAIGDAVSPNPPGPAPAPATAALPPPRGGLADPATWSRAIGEESDRVARYGHPATVVMVELPQLDRLIGAFGRGVADRVATETARLLVAEVRESDRIARLDDARFGILLVGTGETEADAYVERVRAATGTWLASVGLTTRLSFGRASPADGRSVAAAAVLAEERMHDASRASL